MNTFKGYLRKNGKAGVRNHVIVLSTVTCANSVVERLSRRSNIPGVTHANGCIQLGEDLYRTQKLIEGIALHPNVGAVLLVGLGCEQVKAEPLYEIVSVEKPCSYVVIQEEGGTNGAVEKGLEEIEKLKKLVSKDRRVELPISMLTVATKCGSSDTTSGLASNPSLGQAIDAFIEMGGAALLSESYGLLGCEDELKRRAINDNVVKSIHELLRKTEKRALEMGQDIYQGNPTPGNINGGITTLTEKSMGAVVKAGTKPIQGVLNLGDRINGSGLWIIDTPSQDVLTVSSQVASGAQIVAFTTGKGTPVGNPIAPVIKITGNPQTAVKMKDNIDIDTSPILFGRKTIKDLGNQVLKRILDTANGSLTKAEELEHQEFALPKEGASM